MATAPKRKSSTKPKGTGRVALAKVVKSAGKAVMHPCSVNLIIPTGYTPWRGGKCPVPAETIVDYIRAGHGPAYGRRAGELRWSHAACMGDIVAYRVVDEQGGYLHLPKHGLTAGETAAAARHGEPADAAEGSALVMRDVASSAEALTKAMHGLRSVVESAPRFDARSFAVGLTCGSGTVFLGLLLGRVLDAVL